MAGGFAHGAQISFEIREHRFEGLLAAQAQRVHAGDAGVEFVQDLLRLF